MTSEIEEPKSTGGVVARGVAISGATNIFLRFLDIAIAVLLLRWLSIFEFGVYRLALAAYDFATGFFLSGIENVVVSDVSGALLKEPRAAKNLFTVYVVFLGFVAVGIAAVFFWGGNFLASRFPGIEAYTSIVAFLFLLSPLETAYKLKFQIFLDFGWSSAFRVLRDVSRLLSLGGLFFFFSFYFHFSISYIRLKKRLYFPKYSFHFVLSENSNKAYYKALYRIYHAYSLLSCGYV